MTRRVLLAVLVLLVATGVASAQDRRGRVVIEADLIACVLPSTECEKGTLVRVKAGERELELNVLNILQITNQLSVPQILTELRRFKQTAIGPKELLDQVVAPKPLKIRVFIRLEARTLFVQVVQPASQVDLEISN